MSPNIKRCLLIYGGYRDRLDVPISYNKNSDIFIEQNCFLIEIKWSLAFDYVVHSRCAIENTFKNDSTIGQYQITKNHV